MCPFVSQFGSFLNPRHFAIIRLAVESERHLLELRLLPLDVLLGPSQVVPHPLRGEDLLDKDIGFETAAGLLPIQDEGQLLQAVLDQAIQVGAREVHIRLVDEQLLHAQLGKDVLGQLHGREVRIRPDVQPVQGRQNLEEFGGQETRARQVQALQVRHVLEDRRGEVAGCVLLVRLQRKLLQLGQVHECLVRDRLGPREFAHRQRLEIAQVLEGIVRNEIALLKVQQLQVRCVLERTVLDCRHSNIQPPQVLQVPECLVRDIVAPHKAQLNQGVEVPKELVGEIAIADVEFGKLRKELAQILANVRLLAAMVQAIDCQALQLVAVR